MFRNNFFFKLDQTSGRITGVNVHLEEMQGFFFILYSVLTTIYCHKIHGLIFSFLPQRCSKFIIKFSVVITFFFQIHNTKPEFLVLKGYRLIQKKNIVVVDPKKYIYSYYLQYEQTLVDSKKVSNVFITLNLLLLQGCSQLIPCSFEEYKNVLFIFLPHDFQFLFLEIAHRLWCSQLKF